MTDSLLSQAEQDVRAGRWADAETLFRAVLRGRPNDPQALFALSAIAFRRSDLAESERMLRRFIRLQPNHADAHSNLGVVLRERGDPQRAVAAYRRAIRLKPDFAAAYHNLGNALRDLAKLDEAVDAWRRALRLADNPDTHRNLAQVLQQQGQLAAAAGAYRAALAGRPGDAESWHELAVLLARLGEATEAETAYRQAIGRRPAYPEAWCNLGNLLAEQRKLDLAVAAYRQAIGLKPDFAEAFVNLSNALREAGQNEAAVDAGREAVRLRPDLPEAYNNLGTALWRAEKPAEAIAAYRLAIRYRPGYAGALSNLSALLRETGEVEEAVAVGRRAIQFDANSAEAHLNLGYALRDQRKLEESVAAYRRAIELRPDYAQAYVNLGNVLHETGEFRAAMAAYRAAIGLAPDLAEAHFGYGFGLLAEGDFAPGWEEYEWRLAMQRREIPAPRWGGEPLPDKTLLVWSEQGLGDAIQFSRYLGLVRSRVGRLIFAVRAPLLDLFRGGFGDLTVVPEDSVPAVFDAQIPLMSLPRLMQTRVGNIPADVPYLSVDPRLTQKWRTRLAPFRSPTVGVVWGGNPGNLDDRQRSLPAAELARLLSVAGIAFFALQVGERTGDLAGLQGCAVEDLSADVAEFTETAAAMCALDLCITVDTAAAHLAGALGRPVWVLLPFAADWRWQRDRADSPWYPTMWLFRQPRAGDWSSVIAQVHSELSRLIAADPQSAVMAHSDRPGPDPY